MVLLLVVMVLVLGVLGEDTHRFDASVEGGLASSKVERLRLFRLEPDDST